MGENGGEKKQEEMKKREVEDPSTSHLEGEKKNRKGLKKSR